MVSNTEAFKRELGLQLSQALGVQYRYLRSHSEYCAATQEDHDVVSLEVLGKWSPYVSVAFRFGRRFAAATQAEHSLGLMRRRKHIHMYSFNRHWMRNLAYSGPTTWEVDINAPPPSLAEDITTAVHGVADPFFERFRTLRSARDAIVERDPWCLEHGPIWWHSLLTLDYALGERAHFDRWVQTINPFYRKQAEEVLARLPSE